MHPSNGPVKEVMSFGPSPKLVTGLGNGEEPYFPGKLIDLHGEQLVATEKRD